ncbi:adenosine kinase [Trifolium repens]|nr:adenosine kinase [Trifolium repens]
MSGQSFAESHIWISCIGGCPFFPILCRLWIHVWTWGTDNVEEIALKISPWPKASGTCSEITVIMQGADPVCVAEDGKLDIVLVFHLNSAILGWL